jgi:hypothetical protein
MVCELLEGVGGMDINSQKNIAEQRGRNLGFCSLTDVACNLAGRTW